MGPFTANPSLTAHQLGINVQILSLCGAFSFKPVYLGKIQIRKQSENRQFPVVFLPHECEVIISAVPSGEVVCLETVYLISIAHSGLLRTMFPSSPKQYWFKHYKWKQPISYYAKSRIVYRWSLILGAEGHLARSSNAQRSWHSLLHLDLCQSGIYIFTYFRFCCFFMCMGLLSARVSFAPHVCLLPEENRRVTDGYETTCGCCELNPSPLQVLRALSQALKMFSFFLPH